MNDNQIINFYTDTVVSQWDKFEQTDIFKKKVEQQETFEYLSIGTNQCLVIDSIDGVKMEFCRMEITGTSLKLVLQYRNGYSGNPNHVSQIGTYDFPFDNYYSFDKSYFYKKDNKGIIEVITGIKPSREMIKNVVTKIVTDLKTITFEPLEGGLVCAIDNVDKSILEANIAMSSLGKCKNDYGLCGACRDNTITKFTKCGHHYCVRCISNIELLEDEYDSDGFSRHSCPMCRDIMTEFGKNRHHSL